MPVTTAETKESIGSKTENDHWSVVKPEDRDLRRALQAGLSDGLRNGLQESKSLEQTLRTQVTFNRTPR